MFVFSKPGTSVLDRIVENSNTKTKSGSFKVFIETNRLRYLKGLFANLAVSVLDQCSNALLSWGT